MQAHENTPQTIGLSHADILYYIFRFLSPEQVVHAIFNRFSRDMLEHNDFWKQKYQHHFPDLYSAVSAKKNVHWLTEFRDAYNKIYVNGLDKSRPGFPLSQKKLISLVKEQALEDLKNREITISNLDDFVQPDLCSLIDIAARFGNQQIQDLFYQIAVNEMKVEDDEYDEEFRDEFYWALAFHQCETIKQYLKNKAKLLDLYEKEYDNFAPVHLVARLGYLDIMASMIELSKNFTALLASESRSGRTPLSFAVIHGQTEMVRYLLSQEININQTDENGFSALHHVLFLDRHAPSQAPITSLLLEAGIDTTLKENKMGQQVIHFAIGMNLFTLVKLLVEHDAKLVHETFKTVTPVLYAVIFGYTEIVKYLIEKGANIHTSHNEILPEYSIVINNFLYPGEKNYNLLDFAIEQVHNEIVKILVQHGLIPTPEILNNLWHRHRLDNEAQAMLDLVEYIPSREKKNEFSLSSLGIEYFNQPFTLFGHKFNMPKNTKLLAARKLKDVLFKQADAATLKEDQEICDALRNGKLGEIREKAGIRL